MNRYIKTLQPLLIIYQLFLFVYFICIAKNTLKTVLFYSHVSKDLWTWISVTSRWHLRWWHSLLCSASNKPAVICHVRIDSLHTFKWQFDQNFLRIQTPVILFSRPFIHFPLRKFVMDFGWEKLEHEELCLILEWHHALKQDPLCTAVHYSVVVQRSLSYCKKRSNHWTRSEFICMPVYLYWEKSLDFAMTKFCNLCFFFLLHFAQIWVDGWV